MKRKLEPETQPTFEIFFKEEMMEEEQRLRQPKKVPKTSTHSPEKRNKSPASPARSSSPGAGWKLFGALAAPFIEGFRRKHWPTQKERDEDAYDMAMTKYYRE